jgi:hypothetical protein
MPHKDPTQRNAYHRAYYRENKAVINARLAKINRERRHDRYAQIQILKSAPCTDCGKSISEMVKRMFAWETVLAEIAKCDLVCACCHRLRTYHGDANYRSRRFVQHRMALDALKSTTPCLDCGETFKPCQMDFDHVGAGTKTANVTQLLGRATEALVAEIGKCHLVCGNCHRVRGHKGERPHAPEHSEQLIARFRDLMARTPPPEDARANPFPKPELLGKLPDKELVAMTGISREMVAWHRRKAGIALTRQGARV